MRIGLLGGTFDPPHSAHLAIARAAMTALALDEVMFVPANQNPLKGRRGVTSPKDRLDMVKLAIEDEERMSVSDIEITRGGRSYAVDTLEELVLAQPADYWFIVGSDSLSEIAQWKKPDRLVKLCRIAVVSRPKSNVDQILRRLPEEIRDRIDVVEMEPTHESSTEIRERIARHKSVDIWVKPSVAEYIASHGLYGEPS